MGMPNGYDMFVSLLCIYRNYIVEDAGLEVIKPMDPRIPEGPRLMLDKVM